MSRFAKCLAVVAGLVFLCTAPGLGGDQTSQPRPLQHSPKPSHTVRPKNAASPEDDFAGLKLTGDQQEKIDKIHQDIKSRMDIVQKDEKLRPEQKGAMLEGYRRIERAQIYDVLTPDQRTEVRQRVRARRAAEQGQIKNQPPPK
jgi:Spy/CpxP family protein refolding chaperone